MEHKFTVAQIKGWERGIKKFLAHSKTKTEHLIWKGLFELLILLKISMEQKRDISRRVEQLNGAFNLALSLFMECFGTDSRQFRFLLGISTKINKTL